MTTETAARGPGGRTGYDPFLLPSATGARFVLLVVAASLGAMYVGFWYLPYLAVFLDSPLSSMPSCAEWARSAVDDRTARELLDGLLGCSVRQEWLAAAGYTASAPAWAVLTVAIYAAYPALLRRKLRPLPEDGAAEAARIVAAELGAVPGGGPKSLTPLVTPGTAGGARVFGAFGRYWIAVDRALLVDWDAETPSGAAVRAVVRHELAHLRNRDVDLTYLAMAAWQAFLLLLVPPVGVNLLLVLATADSATPDLLLRFVAAPLAAAATALFLLHLTRALVLRTREHYADVRAAADASVARALRDAFADMARGARSVPRWRRWFGWHPDPGARRAVLDDPRGLARIRGGDLFLAGVLLGVGQVHLGLVCTLLLERDEVLGVGTAALLLGAPVGAIVAAVVWQAVYAAGRRPPALRRAAALLAAGVLLGQAVPHEFAYRWTDLLAAHPGLAVLSAAALWLCCLLFLRWVALGARLCLAAARRGRLACLVGLGCAAAVFGCLLALWNIGSGIMLGESELGVLWAVWGAVFATFHTWYLPVGLLAAALFVHAAPVGADPGRLRRLWAAPLLGLGVAAGYTVAGTALMFLTVRRVASSGGTIGPETGSLLYLWTIVAGVLLAVAVSVALGALFGGRGRIGVVLSAVAVVLLVAASLEPFAITAVVQGSVCLTEPGTGCWTVAAGALLDQFAESGMGMSATAVLLVVCWPAAAAAAALRSRLGRSRAAVGGGTPVVGRSGAAALLVPVAAVALLLRGEVVQAFERVPLVSAEEREELRQRVEPGTVDLRDTCAGVGEVFPDKDILAFRDDTTSHLVPLASSRDPVLAAVGAAAIDGFEVEADRFFLVVLRYCMEVAG
ncbi:M48 family metalloprotease [Thermobifida cellulosilytica]|uniref:Peptidase M48 domain-containing protein n=1 Tax=Thermobifida cellulosilytica TB100 TaxID=665004 RepID=A0A147KJ44_THECS|nr:M48 family metalloprotease [Thermobifida cellulosilytica]KUP97273.1 hypothetical protein AC529_07810 [Thermobifida cellulosilytica TB100]